MQAGCPQEWGADGYSPYGLTNDKHPVSFPDEPALAGESLDQPGPHFRVGAGQEVVS